jgi:hypothetical protein
MFIYLILYGCRSSPIELKKISSMLLLLSDRAEHHRRAHSALPRVTLVANRRGGHRTAASDVARSDHGTAARKSAPPSSVPPSSSSDAILHQRARLWEKRWGMSKAAREKATTTQLLFVCTLPVLL